MRAVITLLLFLLSGLGTIGQAQSGKQKDHLGNTYSWSPTEIKKINPNELVVFSWQNPAGGNISWVDPSDPFRIVAFSKETNTIHQLNNKLSPIGDPILLDEINQYDVIAACRAKKGGFWVLDQSKQSLINLSANLSIQSQTSVTVPYLDDDETSIQMIEYHQNLLLLIPSHSLIIFDLFGSRINIITTEAEQLQLSPDGLLLYSHKDTLSYDPQRASLRSLIKKL